MVIRQVLLVGSFCLIMLFVSMGRGSCNSPGSMGSFSDFVAEVENQTGYSIAYAIRDLPLSVNFPDISGMGPQDALWSVLEKDDYRLLKSGKHIIIKKNPPKPVEDINISVTVVPDAQMVDRIPPPPQSVFSGGTRLIIMRRDTTSQMATQRTTTVHTISRDHKEDRHERETGITEIPFRSDLLANEAYMGTAPQSRKERRAYKKSLRSVKN